MGSEDRGVGGTCCVGFGDLTKGVDVLPCYVAGGTGVGTDVSVMREFVAHYLFICGTREERGGLTEGSGGRLEGVLTSLVRTDDSNESCC